MTYFKVASPAPDALSESPLPHSLFFVSSRHSPHTRTYIYIYICIHTHATRIRKSHAVLNDTPDTYFVEWTKSNSSHGSHVQHLTSRANSRRFQFGIMRRRNKHALPICTHILLRIFVYCSFIIRTATLVE